MGLLKIWNLNILTNTEAISLSPSTSRFIWWTGNSDTDSLPWFECDVFPIYVLTSWGQAASWWTLGSQLDPEGSNIHPFREDTPNALPFHLSLFPEGVNGCLCSTTWFPWCSALPQVDQGATGLGWNYQITKKLMLFSLKLPSSTHPQGVHGLGWGWDYGKTSSQSVKTHDGAGLGATGLAGNLLWRLWRSFPRKHSSDENRTKKRQKGASGSRGDRRGGHGTGMESIKL